MKSSFLEELTVGEKLIVEQLVEMLVKVRGLRDVHGTNRRHEAGLIAQVQLVGHTANYFGGYEAMSKLYSDVDRDAPRGDDIGSILDKAWHGIGTWLS